MTSLIGMVAWLAGASCPTRDSPPETAAPAPHADQPALQEEEATREADLSLYNLASPWTDQNGVERELTSLSGRIQLVSLVYTNCSYTCPGILASMKRIEAAVPEVAFVLVSIDPERDTPGRLLEFARGSRLDPRRYTLFNGVDPDLLELAAALNVRYRKVQNGEFVHSNVITVLDAAGNAVHQQKGFDTTDQTIDVLQRMIAAK